MTSGRFLLNQAKWQLILFWYDINLRQNIVCRHFSVHGNFLWKFQSLFPSRKYYVQCLLICKRRGGKRRLHRAISKSDPKVLQEGKTGILWILGTFWFIVCLLLRSAIITLCGLCICNEFSNMNEDILVYSILLYFRWVNIFFFFMSLHDS